MPQVLLARPTAEFTREAAIPLAQERAARRFAAWRADPNQRPPFAVPSTGTIAAAIACPDLFLLDTPLGQERLNAIVALVEAARAANQRLAILTATPENANAIVLALPAEGVGRAKADSETDLPAVVAEQTAKVMALAEWRTRRTSLLFQKQETAKQLNWWKEWDRLVEAEAAVAPSPASELTERLNSLDAELAAKIEPWKAAERVEAEIRKTIEAQLAQSRPDGGGLGGFVKKLFGGSKADPNTAAAEVKLKELDAAAVTRNQLIAEAEAECGGRRNQFLAAEQTRIEALRTEQHGQFQARRDALNATRPGADANALAVTLSELEAKIAETDHPPSAPLRESMHRLDVVVGPFAALDGDPFFAPTHPEAEPSFDRVLFADAEDLNEGDLTRAARLANAWTMLGSSDLPKPAYRNGKPGRGEFFRETFDAVRVAPWRYENGQPVAILVPGDSRGLRSEPLADNPAIQLRFCDRPDGVTELAEVAFPPRFTLIEMKRFLFAELGAPKAQFLGLPEWTETTEQITCMWSRLGTAFELGFGIQETLADGVTTQFRFATAAGWTRESAEAWYAEHFGSLSATRAARLAPLR